MDMLRYLDLFLAESREHLGAAYKLQTRLVNESGDPTLWRELLRHAHSLKGMAAAMGYDSMVILAHAMEELLERLQVAGPLELQDHLPRLGEGLDCLDRIVDRVERGEDGACVRAEELAQEFQNTVLRPGAVRVETTPEPPRPRETSAEPPEGPDDDAPACWRVDLSLRDEAARSAQRTVAILDRLASLGRVVQANPPLLSLDTGGFEGRLRLILASHRSRGELQSALDRIDGVGSASLDALGPTSPARLSREAAKWIRVRADKLEALVEGLLELELQHGRLKIALAAVPRRVRHHLERTEFQLKAMYGTLMELRLVPFESVAHRLHQSVHELSRELGKNVFFEILGGHVRLDRAVLEGLLDPLLHLVRNALDHGLEPAADRGRAGKPARGTLRVSLERRGDRIHITVDDDGRGMSVEALKRKALDAGLIDRDASEQMNEDDALMLATIPGLSTARRVSHISGRGVGLDVVKSQVEQLGGLLRIGSRPARGCQISLSVPLSLALVQALLVRSSGELFAVPVDSIERVVKVGGGLSGAFPEPGAVEGGAVEYLRLDRQLGLERPATADPGGAWALLLATRRQRVGLVVDEMLGRGDVVVKPFRAPLQHLRAYSGAALMEDGSIALVLDPLQVAAVTV